jgi:hypothetical protein
MYNFVPSLVVNSASVVTVMMACDEGVDVSIDKEVHTGRSVG